MKNNDAFRFLLKLLACLALMAGGSAQAAITCSLTSNGFFTLYVPAAATTNITQASFTMTCTRSVSTDATSQNYTVKADNGLYSLGVNNRAASGTNYIRYDNYIDSACGTSWKGNTSLPLGGGTITFASANDFLPHSQTVPFWGCIAAGITTVAAATYTDTVTMTPSLGPPATFPVTITTSASCTISSPPGNVSFTYTSFQSTAASASTNFAATCTNQMPYTMALDATSGTLVGLSYALSLSASSATGTGLAQSHTINGSIAAGQAGTCAGASCTATAPRTLTISY